MEKGLQFFTDQVETEIETAVSKWGAEAENKSFQVGWLKGALAWERWQNQEVKFGTKT